jgi:hypothetical protein
MTTKIITLVPECMPEFYPKNKYIRGIAYTATGYLLPCCWLDTPRLEQELLKYGLLDENLKLANNATVEDIIHSPQWQNFLNILISEQDNAPSKCKEKCGSAKQNK